MNAIPRSSLAERMEGIAQNVYRELLKDSPDLRSKDAAEQASAIQRIVNAYDDFADVKLGKMGLAILTKRLREMLAKEATYDIRIGESQRHVLFYALELLQRLPASALVLQDSDEVGALFDMLQPPRASLPQQVQNVIVKHRQHYAYPDADCSLSPTGINDCTPLEGVDWPGAKGREERARADLWPE